MTNIFSRQRFSGLELKFSRITPNIVLCPVCDYAYLRPVLVEAFLVGKGWSSDMHLRALMSQHTHGGMNLTSDGKMEDNPSPEYDSVQLGFDCDQCGAVLRLCILNKGSGAELTWQVELYAPDTVSQ